MALYSHVGRVDARDDLTPKYCVPVSMTGFKKVGWSQYEATYSMRAAQGHCEGIRREICGCAGPAKLGSQTSRN